MANLWVRKTQELHTKPAWGHERDTHNRDRIFIKQLAEKSQERDVRLWCLYQEQSRLWCESTLFEKPPVFLVVSRHVVKVCKRAIISLRSCSFFSFGSAWSRNSFSLCWWHSGRASATLPCQMMALQILWKMQDFREIVIDENFESFSLSVSAIN